MEFKLEKDYYDELILLRRHIHKHAEPSFCEEETTNYICGYRHGKTGKMHCFDTFRIEPRRYKAPYNPIFQS